MTSDGREMDAAAAMLIRAFLTGDRFAVNQVMTRWVAGQPGAAGGQMAIAVADMAAMILTRLCQSRAQAAAEAQAWIDGVVVDRTQRAA